MLVSAREMALGDDHEGIVELPDATPVGLPYATWAGLYDPVIEIGGTPNRGDALSVRGVARDLAAACGTVGHVGALRRLRVGPFTESASISLDKCMRADDTPPASPDLLLPVATALADIPALALTFIVAGEI